MTVDEVDETDRPDSPSPMAAGRTVPVAPYMSGATFTNMFDKYAANGLPDVFDISFFGNISGSTIAQTRSTMRYFDLIDDEYRPTSRMQDLVAADQDARKAILKPVVEDKFADALALTQNATSGQLSKVFAERGINGATVDKAIAFYLHLLDFLGMPYSGHFKKRRPSTSGARRRRSAKPDAPDPSNAQTAASPPKASTEQDQKARYVEMLMDLAVKDGAEPSLQQDLLDRIERALKIGDSPAATSEAEPSLNPK